VKADPRELAERIRAALVQSALHAYEDAGVRGLCAEGRWEVALGAMQSLDLSGIVPARPAGDD
jgi:pentatricopeptide repeat protein